MVVCVFPRRPHTPRHRGRETGSPRVVPRSRCPDVRRAPRAGTPQCCAHAGPATAAREGARRAVRCHLGRVGIRRRRHRRVGVARGDRGEHAGMARVPGPSVASHGAARGLHSGARRHRPCHSRSRRNMDRPRGSISATTFRRTGPARKDDAPSVGEHCPADPLSRLLQRVRRTPTRPCAFLRPMWTSPEVGRGRPSSRSTTPGDSGHSPHRLGVRPITDPWAGVRSGPADRGQALIARRMRKNDRATRDGSGLRQRGLSTLPDECRRRSSPRARASVPGSTRR